ncbi:MAG: hypothetical protein RSB08_04080, partial [Clostridia bacterium]
MELERINFDNNSNPINNSSPNYLNQVPNNGFNDVMNSVEKDIQYNPQPVYANSDADDMWALAEKGNPDAQNKVGTCYVSGYGVPQSYLKGIDWFIKAAVQGHTGAFANLGVCFLSGL